MSRSRTPCCWFAAAISIASFLPCPSAVAEDEAELAAARALFAEALQDQGEGRLAVALEKFRRVRRVRDTAPVEYRIGTCEEGLGRLSAAAVSYESAVRLGSEVTGSESVAAGARERLAAVQKRIGHLTLDAARAGPARPEILVDGSVPSALAGMPIDPGPHVVTASAPGASPFRSEVIVPEGGGLTVAVVLHPLPPPATAARGASPAGWIAAGSGVAMLAASTILLVVRMNDIDALNAACPPPSGDCKPGSSPSDLEATRSRALVEGPVAAGLGAAGALAAGVGLFLLLRPSSRAPVAVAAFGAGERGLFLRGSF